MRLAELWLDVIDVHVIRVTFFTALAAVSEALRLSPVHNLTKVSSRQPVRSIDLGTVYNVKEGFSEVLKSQINIIDDLHIPSKKLPFVQFLEADGHFQVNGLKNIKYWELNNNNNNDNNTVLYLAHFPNGSMWLTTGKKINIIYRKLKNVDRKIHKKW